AQGVANKRTALIVQAEAIFAKFLGGLIEPVFDLYLRRDLAQVRCIQTVLSDIVEIGRRFGRSPAVDLRESRKKWHVGPRSVLILRFGAEGDATGHKIA